MKDGIKEILDYLRKYIDNEETGEVIESKHTMNLLLDYITNLQEENERYKKIFEGKEKFSKIMPDDTDFIILSKADYDRQQIELQDRIFKAIEYIEKYVSYYDMEGDLRNRLLDILKGDNK